MQIVHSVNSVVVMGVAGCGKSSLAGILAQALDLRLCEGDDYHSTHNVDKMRNGIALTDADRAEWLADLGKVLHAQPTGLILSCSALRRIYRDQLRASLPTLRFIFVDITPEEATSRVQQRAAHYFSAGLVQSQFATLEPPIGEPGVLRVDAVDAPAVQLVQAKTWLLATP